MYLEKFILPSSKCEERIIERNSNLVNYYPCTLFTRKGFFEVDFEKITIFYGGNGSGKSTLLNLIAEKLKLNRIAPYNTSDLFNAFTQKCDYRLGIDDEGFEHRIPNGSRIITSDDIFDYMLAIRSNNNDITQNKEDAKEKWAMLKFGETIKLSGLEDYDALRMQVLARNKTTSRRQFIKKTVGDEVRLNSNGETALMYFEKKLKNDTLYCLDEPENSMSPKMQLDLVKMLEEMARYCGCQFIIATHSPFLLALENAKIYDLDSAPVKIKDWWQLENAKIYFEFFQKHKHLFLED